MAVKMAVMPRSLLFQHSAARTPLRCSMANEMPTALVHRAIMIAQRFSSVRRNNAYRESASAELPHPIHGTRMPKRVLACRHYPDALSSLRSGLPDDPQG